MDTVKLKLVRQKSWYLVQTGLLYRRGQMFKDGKEQPSHLLSSKGTRYAGDLDPALAPYQLPGTILKCWFWLTKPLVAPCSNPCRIIVSSVFHLLFLTESALNSPLLQRGLRVAGNVLAEMPLLWNNLVLEIRLFSTLLAPCNFFKKWLVLESLQYELFWSCLNFKNWKILGVLLYAYYIFNWLLKYGSS